LTLTLATVWMLDKHQQKVESERLLKPLLEDEEWSKLPEVWRMAAKLAAAQDLSGRRMECLERALDIEYRDPNVNRSRDQAVKEYREMMEHYQKLAEAMVTLKVKPPEDFLAKVVKTADRWRTLSRDGSYPCEVASRILRQLGEKELAWDYLTTTVAEHPGESSPWLRLAGTLRQHGEMRQADSAFASAFSTEPTNAQILWDRAQNLRQMGNGVESKKLLLQLAEGKWQPRFQSIQAQARWQLEQR
jgi:tetratricopeptide (TPR) repeat protein